MPTTVRMAVILRDINELADHRGMAVLAEEILWRDAALAEQFGVFGIRGRPTSTSAVTGCIAATGLGGRRQPAVEIRGTPVELLPGIFLLASPAAEL